MLAAGGAEHRLEESSLYTEVGFLFQGHLSILYNQGTPYNGKRSRSRPSRTILAQRAPGPQHTAHITDFVNLIRQRFSVVSKTAYRVSLKERRPPLLKAIINKKGE